MLSTDGGVPPAESDNRMANLSMRGWEPLLRRTTALHVTENVKDSFRANVTYQSARDGVGEIQRTGSGSSALSALVDAFESVHRIENKMAEAAKLARVDDTHPSEGADPGPAGPRGARRSVLGYVFRVHAPDKSRTYVIASEDATVVTRGGAGESQEDVAERYASDSNLERSEVHLVTNSPLPISESKLTGKLAQMSYAYGAGK